MSLSFKSKPYEIEMSQLVLTKESVAKADQGKIEKLVTALQKMNENVVLPIACLTEDEDKYLVLEGVEIVLAAKKVGYQTMWIFLMGSRQGDQKTTAAIEQVQATQ